MKLILHYMKRYKWLVLLNILSVFGFALVELGWLIPAALTLCFAFLTVRKDEMTVLEYLKYAIRYFLTDQQYYEWK